MGDLLFLKKGSTLPLIVHNPIDSRTYATENWHPHHHYLNIIGALYFIINLFGQTPSKTVITTSNMW